MEATTQGDLFPTRLPPELLSAIVNELSLRHLVLYRFTLFICLDLIHMIILYICSAQYVSKAWFEGVFTLVRRVELVDSYLAMGRSRRLFARSLFARCSHHLNHVLVSSRWIKLIVIFRIVNLGIVGGQQLRAVVRRGRSRRLGDCFTALAQALQMQKCTTFSY